MGTSLIRKLVKKAIGKNKIVAADQRSGNTSTRQLTIDGGSGD
jgi:hypothetical protein